VRSRHVALGAVIALLLNSAPARAVSPPTPWDGVNPFDCTIQDAGQGTTVPDPGADPYCVRFDKTNQNITELGLVDFLSKEPARVAAAVPKCFYYQEDHWRGSLVQSDQQTVVYEFYGHYFFNKATGDGGVWVTGFTVAGQTFDPRSLPGFPRSGIRTSVRAPAESSRTTTCPSIRVAWRRRTTRRHPFTLRRNPPFRRRAPLRHGPRCDAPTRPAVSSARASAP
jgi:hypothetical protein